MVKQRLTVGVAIALALVPTVGRSNGRFPQAQHLVGGPGAASATLALRTTFGVLVSPDRGRSWSFYCEEAVGVGGQTIWDAPIALSGAGTLFVGLPDGLVRVADGCSAPRVGEVGQDFTADLTTTADGATLYWIGSRGTTSNRVLASTDGGRTFAARGAVRDGVLLETIEASDVAPGRVYLTGVELDSQRFILFRSDDGGRSFREFEIAQPGIRGAYLAGLDPRDADVVWVRAQQAPGAEKSEGSLLLRSRDGGQRFEVVAQTTGPMLGFALSGDGTTAWYGGPSDGLWRGAVGGSGFTRVADVPVLCLRWHDGGLFACASYLRTGWALGRSEDGGARFAPVLRFEDLPGPPRCPAGTPGAQICPGRWSVLRRVFAPDAGSGGPGVNVGGADASTATPDAATAATPQGSGRCAVGRGQDDRGLPVAAAALALALYRRRRNARRRGACRQLRDGVDPRSCRDAADPCRATA